MKIIYCLVIIMLGMYRTQAQTKILVLAALGDRHRPLVEYGKRLARRVFKS